MMSLVQLNESEVAEARALASLTFEKFQSMAGHYNNTVDSHLKGKIGEIAVEKFLATSNNPEEIDSAFRNLRRDSECDILIGSIRIEVKTWTRMFWREYGRCISVKQLPTLLKKADFIIWCVAEPPTNLGCDVSVVGWNRVDEIARAPRRLTGPQGKRQVDNYQLDEVHIAAMNSFPLK